MNKLQRLCKPNSRMEHNNWFSNLESTHWLNHIKTILFGLFIMLLIFLKKNSRLFKSCSFN